MLRIRSPIPSPSSRKGEAICGGKSVRPIFLIVLIVTILTVSAGPQLNIVTTAN